MTRWRAPLALALVVPIAIAACGGSEETGSSPGASDSAAPSGSASPSDRPLRVGWLSEPDTMNPLTTYSTEAVEVTQLIYDKLLDYDRSLHPEPSLATDFAYSADGTSISFTLRDGVTWQDGQPFTADDVVFTYELVHANNLGQYAQFLTDMTSVTATDPTHVVLAFSAPQAFNPGLVVPIVPKHIWGSLSATSVESYPNDAPIGTGPYRFSEWQKGASLTVARNDDWWGTPPGPATITWVRYDNSDVMGQALRSGELDVIPQVPPAVYDGLAGADGIKLAALPSYSFHHIGFNVSGEPGSLGNPLLRDVAVRTAIQYAVDRTKLVQLCLSGHGQPGDTIVPAGLADWHYAVPPGAAFDHDPEKAKQLLDAAGYRDDGSGVRAKDGKRMEFRIIAIATTDVDVCAAKLVVDAAAEVGIKLELQTLDETTLGDTVYNTDAPNWDLFVWGWDSGTADPSYMLGVPLCDQIGNNNDVFYCDDTYDADYAKQAQTVDTAARKAITDRMQQRFYESATYLVMWYQDKLQAYRTDTWTGWQEIPGGVIFNFTRDNYLTIQPAG